MREKIVQPNPRHAAFRTDKKTVYPHRRLYELLVGPVPEGMQVDHICQNRLCVNPLHLQPVHPSENQVFAVARRRCDAA